jgi:hypothetical protein
MSEMLPPEVVRRRNIVGLLIIIPLSLAVVAGIIEVIVTYMGY